MGRRDTITMSVKEAKRLHLVQQAIEKRITQAEAAQMTGLSLRQTQRIVARVRQEGDLGISHRARGKEPNNRILPGVKDKVLDLCCGIYHELGPTHASEKLREKDHVPVSAETLRTWFLEEGLP